MVPISNSGTPGFLFHIFIGLLQPPDAIGRRAQARRPPSTQHPPYRPAASSRFNALRRKDAKQEQFRFVLRI